jgi:predicted permease
MSSPSLAYQICTTFLASIRSVGTACTLAAVGIYLHRREFIRDKKTLALIAQQATIPLFLFTKVIYCNQDWSDEPCPDITKSIADIWVLLLWPIYVVGCGLAVGYGAAHLSGTETGVKAIMATCAFGNSTGLPITLLTVVHANFPASTELGQVDPTLFLSVYLLLYPLLTWSVGGWLLAPDKQDEGQITEGTGLDNQDTLPNVLNNDAMEAKYMKRRRGLSETDASGYISTVDLVQLGRTHQQLEEAAPQENILGQSAALPAPETIHEQTALLPMSTSNAPNKADEVPSASRRWHDSHSLRETAGKIAERVFQPPVIGAMLGLLVAATPLRGLFVDLIDRRSRAPLQWLFDGLYQVGQAAVPLNMIILGCNLSASHLSATSDGDQSKLLPRKTMVAIVIGKMLVQPMIGIVSAVFLTQLLNIPESINASFALVAMIVFITPTANNVMLMVELSGSGLKEGIARVITQVQLLVLGG